jgi:CHASE1-domain containing sensor protein
MNKKIIPILFLIIILFSNIAFANVAVAYHKLKISGQKSEYCRYERLPNDVCSYFKQIEDCKFGCIKDDRVITYFIRYEDGSYTMQNMSKEQFNTYQENKSKQLDGLSTVVIITVIGLIIAVIIDNRQNRKKKK